MNQLEGLLILLGLPAALLLSGYWLAALLTDSAPQERLAFGLAAGLAVLLAAVAAMGLFRPLSGLWAYACLSPVALTLLLPRSRRGLVQDLFTTAREAPRMALVASAVFVLLLLWPVIVDPSALFYDGTSNHDSFFWIAGAEHLKRHTYMQMPVVTAEQPLTYPAGAFIGWNPPWGRMGAEGLLALASSVVGLSPLKLYLYGTASLGIVWCALVSLIVRTFVHAAPTRLTVTAVMCLQPVFIFFYGNSNLPNLLGALTGTAAIIAVERALRAGWERRAEFTAWAGLAALSVHGLLCSYPEMVPFVLLSCGLLWLRPWFTGRAGLKTRLAPTVALLAGFALLLGALAGTAAVMVVDHVLRAGLEHRADFTTSVGRAALSVHDLLYRHPEIAPFALLSCGLLWVWPWLTGNAGLKTRLALTVALLAGFALNPATTVRAANGFMASFSSARADATWANLFNPLELAEYIPALVTLSVPGTKGLGPWLGWPLSAAILAAFVTAVRCSRDRFGLLAGLAGGAVLLGYTVATDFAYGWQKTVQFSGLFAAATIPAAAIDALWRLRPATAVRRRLANATLALLVAFLAYATVLNFLDIYKWSNRKVISEDWFALRDQSRAALRDAPVLVDAATFRMAFFHSMWTAYFMRDSHLYFGARGVESGGYLRDFVVNEAAAAIPPPAAVLVGRQWADSFDANSPRLLTGREYALLPKINRVIALSGTSPVSGVPESITEKVALEILPHSPCQLVIDLKPGRKATIRPPLTWNVTREAAGAAGFSATVSGPPPWQLKIPLVAGQHNLVSINLADPAGLPEGLPMAVHSLRIEPGP